MTHRKKFQPLEEGDKIWKDYTTEALKNNLEELHYDICGEEFGASTEQLQIFEEIEDELHRRKIRVFRPLVFKQF